MHSGLTRLGRQNGTILCGKAYLSHSGAAGTKSPRLRDSSQSSRSLTTRRPATRQTPAFSPAALPILLFTPPLLSVS